MAENKCPQCGAPLDPQATECKFCGEKLAVNRQHSNFNNNRNNISNRYSHK